MAVMEFRALGRVTVTRNGTEVDLGAPKLRALLALLLVHRNAVLSADQILEHLWGDDSDDKLKALRVHVSRLRDALDPERTRGEGSVLETVGHGYRLNVDDDKVDVARFEELIASGRAQLRADPAQAAEKLRAALDLWRGSPFEEFLYEEFVQSEVHRLSEIRIDAIEDRIEAELAVGQAGELVSELEVLRQQHPLRERLAAHQALALYRSGRPADALRAIERYRRHVGDELGIDPSPRLLRLEEQILLHDDRIQPQLPSAEGLLGAARVASNPFKGLRPFGADDAGSFFGRDSLIAELLRTIGRGQRLIALVGASGSGKSSVVRAGLVPALAKGAIEGSDQWLIASMVPGAHPFAEMEAALLRSTIDSPASLAAQLDDGATGLVRAALRVLPDNNSHLVLVIDQFEELFTLVDDGAVRDRFLSNLVAAVDDPHARITVLVTLRADFYGQPLAHPEFGARLGAGVVNVTPLTSEELEEAALRPAEQQGVSFEPALLGQLIADVGSRPGSLPLFQYALTELFDRRSGSTLTATSYRAMGGVEGALRRRASELFDELDDVQQRAARQLFLRLVVIGDDGQRSRRRVPAREISSIGVDTAIVQEVLRRFGERRLLSFDSDPLTGAPTVEVAHEALLTAWPTLDEWIGESRDDLRRHSFLTTTLREWQLADRNPDYLLSAARVAAFEGLDESSGISLNGPEREFLDASIDRLAETQAEDERHRAEELRSRRRLRTLVGALAVALGVAAMSLFGVFSADTGPSITFFAAANTDDVIESIAAGVERADRELRMQVDEVRWVIDPVLEFDELAKSRPEMVIVDSFANFVTEIFVDHPDIRFGLVDPDPGLVTNLPNVSYATFRNEEGAFLAGVAAASMTETGVVGFVGGSQIDLIEGFRAGFEAGVAAVDPDVEVLATFVGQFGALGFGDVTAGKARASALYERNADVVFHAAGQSGRGIFVAADEQSRALGRHLWGIGVDIDQWFDTPENLRDHVLTSLIKRPDVAAFLIAEHLLAGGPGGEAVVLGLAEGGYDYSKRGNAMRPDVIAAIDQYMADIIAGRIVVPTRPQGPVLYLDNDGNEITEPTDTPAGVDFPQQYFSISPGTYHLTALGTPLTISIDGDWFVQVNEPGFTAFSHPDSRRRGDRDIVFLRPTVFADPVRPAASIGAQDFWPAGEMSLDRFDQWLNLLPEGILAVPSSRVEIGGREAVYFEVEIAGDFECGREGVCVGFLVNTIGPEGLTGWSFNRGLRYRIWVVNGGDHQPLVILAGTAFNDTGFQPTADDFLATLIIGDPRPHPVDPDDWGLLP
jgi:basic membrane lipoprotein Med (substrate-binding protein (PBP1-ABC) superfamily)/DNA-binding SARP family transcriptional activator